MKINNKETLNKCIILENYAREVFPILKQAINPNNDIRLTFITNQYSLAGYYTHNMIIKLNIPIIIEKCYHCDLEKMKLEVLKILVHELYHTIQFIDEELYDRIGDYYDEVESQVERKTSLFFINNYELIKTLFNIDIIKYLPEFNFIINALGDKGINFCNKNDNLLLYYYSQLKNIISTSPNSFNSGNRIKIKKEVKELLINIPNIVVKFTNNFGEMKDIIIKKDGFTNPNTNCVNFINYSLYLEKIPYYQITTRYNITIKLSNDTLLIEAVPITDKDNYLLDPIYKYFDPQYTGTEAIDDFEDDAQF